MPRTHAPYPPDFRAEAVRLVRASHKPVAEIASELEISHETLRAWVKQADIDDGLRHDGLTTEETEEVRRLRREVKRLREEREILLKAAAGVVTIQQTVQRQQGKGMVRVEPKTGRSRRSVHLASRTVEILRHHQDRQKLAWGAAGRPWNDHVLVFCARSGLPLAPTNIRRSLHRALTRAGLPLVRIHDLRHTAATYLLSLGTHPKKVQELLGHSSILLTLDTYSHVLPPMHQEIAAQMDKLFEGADDESEGVDQIKTSQSPTESGNPAVEVDTGHGASADGDHGDLPSVLPSKPQSGR